MNTKLSVQSRIVALICALSLIGVLVLPIWRIELSAPQYPEGLKLQIHAGKLGGDVEVVNGLNHYIGMRTLHEKDFVEFTVLPYIVGAFVLFGLLSVLFNKRWSSHRLSAINSCSTLALIPFPTQADGYL